MKLLKNSFYFLYKLYYLAVFFTVFLALYPLFLLGFYIIKKPKFTYFLHRIWARILNLLTLVFLTTENKAAKLPKEPLIIISNHTSFLDVFLMCHILPDYPFIFMAKSELLKIPLFKTLFKHYHIPVYRKNQKKAAQSLLKCRKALKNGLSIVIFPEGGIIEGYAPRLAPFKNGAFELAIRENIAVLPITFTRNFKIIEEPNHWFSVARPGIAKAIVHPYISREEVQSMGMSELRKKCFDIIEEPLREIYGFKSTNN